MVKTSGGDKSASACREWFPYGTGQSQVFPALGGSAGDGGHVCEEWGARVVGVEPFEPGAAHLDGVTLFPIGFGETKAEFDAFAVGKMKETAVAASVPELPFDSMLAVKDV